MRLTALQARWLLVALHVPMVAVPVLFTGLGVMGLPGSDPLLPVVLGLAMGGLQLRHSLAAARHVRPRGWVWTLPAMYVLVYLPMWLFGWEVWEGAQFCAVASTLMLLRGRVRVAGFIATVLLVVGGELVISPLGSVFDAVYAVGYGLFSAVPPVILYLATRLVHVLTEVAAAQAELAETAVGRERLRLSRDLHDLFGQSLSAISLKGDLAVRLLPADPAAARAEAVGVTELARDTLRRMRAVTRAEHAVSLRAEVDSAATLLRTAGVRTVLDVRPVSPGSEEIFAWAVREGVTNVLRHSDAGTCSVTVAGRRLEIVNDGARPAGTGGRGIAGLTARAEAVGGSVTAGVAGAEFRLVVELPEEAG